MKKNVKRNDLCNRQLTDLISVGKATLKDFQILGIHSIDTLSKCNAIDLYSKLCRMTNTKHDPCVQDVFSAAIAQARDPDLSLEKCKWWYWSRLRKENGKSKY